MATGDKRPVVMEADRAVAGGIATLGADGKLIDAQIPGVDKLGAAPAVESEEHPGCYYRTASGVVEWINPPMLPGVEYRTTERYLGKPVYAQVFEIDSLPNAAWQEYRFDDTTNQGCNDVVSFSCYTSNRKTIPTMSHGGEAIDNTDAIDIVVQANPTIGIRILVIAQKNRSEVSAKVLVKYTKS